LNQRRLGENVAYMLSNKTQKEDSDEQRYDKNPRVDNGFFLLQLCNFILESVRRAWMFSEDINFAGRIMQVDPAADVTAGRV
jgi:hypothetical protein